MKKLKILRNYLIVLCFNASVDSGCDYAMQTLKILEKNNQVIAYCLGEPITWKDLLAGNLIRKPIIQKRFHSLIFRPFFLLPGQHYILIKTINYCLNGIFLYLYASIKYRPLKKIFWFFEPFYLPCLLSIFQGFYFVYDCVDYFSAFSEYARQCQLKILKKVGYIFVNSKVTFQYLKKHRSDVILVPLGFAQKLFQSHKKKISKAINQKSKTIGFIGGLSSRIDFKLLYQVVKKLPNCKFVFVGPTELNVFARKDSLFEDLDKFCSLPNIIWKKPVSKENIPLVIAEFDIGIIPYNIKNRFNKYCYPMKVFEYFYLGKPVVATPIEELKRFPKFVKIGKNAQEFEKHIKDILKSGWPESYKREQRKVAIANSWEAKIGKISQILNKNL